MPRIIESNLMPEGWCLNLFGIYFTRHSGRLDRYLINHERIHDAQQRELLWIFFYIIYVLEWLLRLAASRSFQTAYMRISFEREAYRHGRDLSYLNNRRMFAQWRK